MSELIPYPSIDSATSTSSPTLQLAKSAKAVVCSTYNTYKNWYHQNVGIDTLPGALLDSFWSAACPTAAPYSPPTSTPPPFTGGQCCSTYYQVSYDLTQNNGSTWQIAYYKDTFQGKIGAMYEVSVSNGTQISYRHNYTSCSGVVTVFEVTTGNSDRMFRPRIGSVTPLYGGANNCGSLPSIPPPPIVAPPTTINNNINIVNKNGTNISVPVSFSPLFLSPTLNLSVKIPVNINASLNPQFDIKPTLNFNFGRGGVSVDSGEDDTINNLGDNITKLGNTINNVSTKIDNVSNTTNNTSNTVNNINLTNNDNNERIRNIQSKLACDPCDLLDKIKKKLDYVPVFTSSSITNFQSVTRDNLFNIGYLQIELIQLPKLGKIVFGGEADDTMYTGWLTWRRNGFNFEKLQITTAKSTYWSPKWADGFSICCTNNARANCIYYIEVKD